MVQRKENYSQHTLLHPLLLANMHRSHFSVLWLVTWYSVFTACFSTDQAVLSLPLPSTSTYIGYLYRCVLHYFIRKGSVPSVHLIWIESYRHTLTFPIGLGSAQRRSDNSDFRCLLPALAGGRTPGPLRKWAPSAQPVTSSDCGFSGSQSPPSCADHLRSESVEAECICCLAPGEVRR